MNMTHITNGYSTQRREGQLATEIGAQNGPVTRAMERARTSRTAVRIGMPIGLCLVQLILAYEWLISGINKMIDPNFAVQLPNTLQQGLSGNPYTWYATILRHIVLPHPTLFALLTEVGEVGIGVTLIAGALLWTLRPSSRRTVIAARVTALTLAGATFLSFNYFLQGGSTLPWINAANALNEGVDIDILLPLLSIALLWSNLRAARTVDAAMTEQTSESERGLSWAS